MIPFICKIEERVILSFKKVSLSFQTKIKAIKSLSNKDYKNKLSTFFTEAKGFVRGILSKPTHYIMHITVIGLSFFVSISTVYGNSEIYASLSNSGKKVSNKVVSNKINPRVVADIASAANAPVEVKEEDFQDNEYSYMSSLAISGGGMVDGSVMSQDVNAARGDVINYTVEGGDTLWSIASKFNITTNTVKWANNITDENSIKPGQTLMILPISGTMHKVKDGDTLAKVASIYNASAPQIMEENGLVGETLEPGQIIIIPGGRVWEPAPKPQPTTKTNTKLASNKSGKKVSWSGGGNAFPGGWCTSYVASRRRVTWRGNAGAWLRNAAAQGYATGRTPQVGSIVVTTESPVGHVALVESVNGDYISISEMNYVGRGIISRRTISANSGVIRGFIY